MSSHGIARSARSRTEEQRQQDLEKISKYRSLENDVRDKVAQKQYDSDTFQLTTKLLRQNPEYYTIWNVRRCCLISGLFSKLSDGSSLSTVLQSSSANAIPTPSSADSSPTSLTEIPPAPNPQTTGKSGTTPESSTDAIEEQQKNDGEVIKAELGFTIPLLMEFPKCYWIWKYRMWTLQQAIEKLPLSTSQRIWKEELGLVSKMLSRDQRNFHAWGYRRRVVAQLESATLDGKSLVEPEFEYTRKKIEDNLSNFSAWHNRSHLLPRLLDERQADHETRKRFFETELDFVREGLNVGPEDQSLWYYHQFLILNLVDRDGRQSIVPDLTIDERIAYIRREIEDITDLSTDYTDVKWIYEALIEYTLAIYRLQKKSLQDEEKAAVAEWMSNLRKLDSMRNGRWNDLQKELDLAQ